MKEKVKMSGKKIALLALVILLAVAILGLCLWFGIASCTSKGTVIEPLNEGTTTRKAVPTDGTKPTDHTAVDNVAYMAYVLDSQPSYHAYANNSTKSTGYEQITQTWKDYRSADLTGIGQSVMVCSDLSYSALVKASTQTCFVGDGAYMRGGNNPSSKSTVPAEIVWDSASPEFYDRDAYRAKYGDLSTELSVYAINADTVERADDVVDNGNGTYTQKYYLKADAACWYQNGMKTRGSLKFLPEFKKIEIEFTFDASWQVLSTYCEESSRIAPKALGGIAMDSSSKTTTTFDYGAGAFDNSHYSNFENYYKNHLGAITPANPGPKEEVPEMLDVLGGGFSKVVDPDGDGQQFALDLTLGGTKYNGTAYAKLGDMSDVLNTLDVRLALEKEGSGKQDLFVNFANGAVKVYFSNGFALNANVNEISDSVNKFNGWVNSKDKKVEAQTVAYALLADGAEEENSSIDFNTLLNALKFTYDDTSAQITLKSDNLLDLGIGIDMQMNFDRTKSEDGSTYAFKDLSLNSLTYKSEPVELELSLKPDDVSEIITRDEVSAPAELTEYIDGVYALVNGNSYLVDVTLDGAESGVKELNGLTVKSPVQVNLGKDFKTMEVYAPVSVDYENISIELEAYYTIDFGGGNYGAAYLHITEICGESVDFKVNCDIKDAADAVTKIIGYFQSGDESVSALSDGEKVDTVASIVNSVLSLDYSALVKELKADENRISVNIDADCILQALNVKNITVGIIGLEVVLKDGKVSLEATASRYGLSVKVTDTDKDITFDTDGYADVTDYLNGVYDLLNAKSYLVKLSLDGSLYGVAIDEATAQVSVNKQFDEITVKAENLKVEYKTLSVKLDVYYNIDLKAGNYGEAYINVKEICGKAVSAKVTCDIAEAVSTVTEIINIFNTEEGTEAQNEEVAATASALDILLGINYAEIIKQIKADGNGINLGLDADKILEAVSADLGGIKLGTVTLDLTNGKDGLVLSGNVEKLGLGISVSGSDKEIEYDTTGYLEANAYLNGVYDLLNAKSYLVKLSLDGSLYGVVIDEATAQVSVDKQFDEITVKAENLKVEYKTLSVKLDVYYNIDLKAGDYGEAYINVKEICGKAVSAKVTCDIAEAVSTVTEIINIFNTEEGIEAQTEEVATTASVLDILLGIDYAEIIKQIKADGNGINLCVDADKILEELNVKLGGIKLGTVTLDVVNTKDGLVLSGNVEKLGLGLSVSGASGDIKFEARGYLDATELIELVIAATEEAQKIITDKDVMFDLNAQVTADGVKATVAGAGEVVWKNGGILVAADVDLTIAEDENSQTVNVKLVYDESSDVLVRLTVDGKGLEIAKSDVAAISGGVSDITDVVNKLTALFGNGGQQSGDEIQPMNLEGGEGDNDGGISLDYAKVINTVLKIVGNFTVQLKDADTDGVKELLITYATNDVLKLSSNGNLALDFTAATADTDIANVKASVSAGAGDTVKAVNGRLAEINFYKSSGERTFVRTVYEYVSDVFDGLTVADMLGGGTYSVEIILDGGKSGIKELSDIFVKADLYYTELERENGTSKLAEVNLELNIKDTLVLANVYFLDNVLYIELNRVGDTELTDVAFKTDAEDIYHVADVLVKTLTGDVLAEILEGLGGEPAALSDGAVGADTQSALTEILNGVLNLDLAEVVKFEKVEGLNTLTLKPDGILELLNAGVKTGDIVLKVNPVTHAIYAGAGEWLTLTAQTAEGHTGIPSEKTFIDIGFIADLLEDLKTTLDNTVTYDADGNVINSKLLFSFTGNISINVVNMATVNIENVVLTIGLDDDNEFYVTFYGYLKDEKVLLGAVQVAKAGYISLTYSGGYITLGRDVNSATKAQYRVLTLDYLVDNILDSNNSPIFWWLGSKGVSTIIGWFSGGLNISSGLTDTQEFYLYGSEEGATSPEEPANDDVFSLTDLLTALKVTVNGRESGYGDYSVKNDFNLTDNYYGFKLSLDSLIGGDTLRNVNAALVRNAEGGLMGIDAYAEVGSGNSSYVYATISLANGMADRHAGNYFKTVINNYGVDFDYYKNYEHSVFGCYDTAGSKYYSSDINKPYKLTVYGFEGTDYESYPKFERGGKKLAEATLNSGSTVYLLEDELWVNDDWKLIYVDENGNDLGLSFTLTGDTVVYAMIVGESSFTFYDYYGEGTEMALTVGDSLDIAELNALVPDVEEDGVIYTFAGWYLDKQFVYGVTSVQVAYSYYAKYVEKFTIAANGVIYTYSNEQGGRYTVTGLDANKADKDYSLSENILIIDGYINGYPVTAIGDGAFKYSNTGVYLKKVIVPETVTYVGAEAFMNNRNMELAVFLADRITFGGSSYNEGDAYPFIGCYVNENGKDNTGNTILNLYYNIAGSVDTDYDKLTPGDTAWMAYYKDKYVGNPGGTLNGSRVDYKSEKVFEGNWQWAYVTFEVVKVNSDKSEEKLSAEYLNLSNGLNFTSMTYAEASEYVLGIMNGLTVADGYINAYSIEIISDYDGLELNGKMYIIKIILTEKPADEWYYSLTVSGVYNGAETAVTVAGDAVSFGGRYYAEAGSSVELLAFNGLMFAECDYGYAASTDDGLVFTMPASVLTVNVTYSKKPISEIQLISAVPFIYGDCDTAADGLTVTLTPDTVTVLDKPEAEGYIFIGWAYDIYNDGNLTFTDGYITAENAVAQYHAIWVVGKGAIQSIQTVTGGADPNAAVVTVNTEKASGFGGMYKDEAFTEEVKSITTETTVLHARLRLTISIFFDGTSGSKTDFTVAGEVNESKSKVEDYEFKLEVLEGESLEISFVQDSGSYWGSTYYWNNCVVTHNDKETTISGKKNGTLVGNNENRVFAIKYNDVTYTTYDTLALENISENISLTSSVNNATK